MNGQQTDNTTKEASSKKEVKRRRIADNVWHFFSIL